MLRDRILAILLEADGAYVSGETICMLMGVTRAAIWKHIEALKKDGYRIEGIPRKGYRLISMPDMIEPSFIRLHLKTRDIGHLIRDYHKLTSTNLTARQLAEEGTIHGTLVLAEEQEGGRGRMGRHWVSPPHRGIYMSLVLRPEILPDAAPKLTMMTAVAVCRAIEEVTGHTPGIKWPNDIVMGNKKICGILTEMNATMDGIEWVIIGIGINVNTTAQDIPPELADIATSILLHTGKPFSRCELIAQICNNMEILYDQFIIEHNFQGIMQFYRERSVTLGKQIHVLGHGIDLQGTALYFDEDGALIVLGERGKRERIISGDVSVRGLMGYV